MDDRTQKQKRRSEDHTADRLTGQIWPKRCQEWLHTAAARCCGVSVFVHVLILLVMGLIVLHEPADDEVPISSGFTAVEKTESRDLFELDVALSQPDVDSSPIDNLAIGTTVGAFEFSEPALITGSAEGPTSGGAPIGYRIGSNAVRKGNFTAWTVPEDPKPWKDYLVVIQIRLPDDVTRYRREDLTGFLTGDDGYTTPIGDFNGRGFPKKYYGEFDMTAKQFVIRIPGAAAKVQDKIEVRSKILNEKQTLFIVF